MQASTLVSIPPQLPEYLKNIHDLKPIVGVPDDEEVIAIHTVIRAASIVFQGLLNLKRCWNHVNLTERIQFLEYMILPCL